MDPIERQLRTGHPLLRVTTIDEEGAAATIRDRGRSVLGEDVAVYEWDACGLRPDGAHGAELEGVLEGVAGEKGPTLYVLRDVEKRLAEAGVARRLRRLIPVLGQRPVRVVLLTPPGELPLELTHDIPTVRFSLPPADVLEALVLEELGESIGDVDRVSFAGALHGLSSLEARLALRRVRADGVAGEALLGRLFAEKAARVRTACVQYFPPEVGLDDVGGLRGLKDWVHLRRSGLVAGVTPRGILLTGISGCGKSYAVKALSRALQVPLFRLDMGQVFSHPHPEAAFAGAVAAIEAIAPCVLWLDEIENALALGAQDSGPAARIAGGFLTWLQERSPGVFVAATANRVELLPAELLRRGRFDQVMFVDLPDDDERKQIWSVHLRRAGLDPAHFDLIVLSGATGGWSGAEIEACVDSAHLEASVDGRVTGRDDVLKAIGQTVPLSVTMQEQMRRIREWAHRRAILASGKPW